MVASNTPYAGIDVTATSTSAQFNLGDRYTTSGSTGYTEYQYVKASAAIAANQYVKISGDGLFTAAEGTTTLLPSTEPAMVGCAQTAIASGSYGWVVRKGYHIGNFAASCVQDVKIYTTATAGVVDDSSTTLIQGLKLITTITSAAASPAFACMDMVTVAA